MTSRFTLPAVNELEEVFDYLNLQQRGLGSEFLDEAERAVAEIGASPHRWPELEPGVRRYRLRRFEYGLVYRIRSDHIEIIAIMHLARRPGYWRDRLWP